MGEFINFFRITGPDITPCGGAIIVPHHRAGGNAFINRPIRFPGVIFPLMSDQDRGKRRPGRGRGHSRLVVPCRPKQISILVRLFLVS